MHLMGILLEKYEARSFDRDFIGKKDVDRGKTVNKINFFFHKNPMSIYKVTTLLIITPHIADDFASISYCF